MANPVRDSVAMHPPGSRDTLILQESDLIFSSVRQKSLHALRATHCLVTVVTSADLTHQLLCGLDPSSRQSVDDHGEHAASGAYELLPPLPNAVSTPSILRRDSALRSNEESPPHAAHSSLAAAIEGSASVFPDSPVDTDRVSAALWAGLQLSRHPTTTSETDDPAHSGGSRSPRVVNFGAFDMPEFPSEPV
jgi:hypothetical protein